MAQLTDCLLINSMLVVPVAKQLMSPGEGSQTATSGQISNDKERL
jgi:hypothetical protein